MFCFFQVQNVNTLPSTLPSLSSLPPLSLAPAPFLPLLPLQHWHRGGVVDVLIVPILADNYSYIFIDKSVHNTEPRRENTHAAREARERQTQREAIRVMLFYGQSYGKGGMRRSCRARQGSRGERRRRRRRGKRGGKRR